MRITRKSGQKWFTAFILSPGMIFASAYFAVWLSTSVYLSHAFKRHLQSTFITEAGQRYQLDIGSLRPGFDLNSITLKKLALTPTGEAGNLKASLPAMQIPELRIECPNLGFFLFMPGDELLSLRTISRQILSSSVQ